MHALLGQHSGLQHQLLPHTEVRDGQVRQQLAGDACRRPEKGDRAPTSVLTEQDLCDLQQT